MTQTYTTVEWISKLGYILIIENIQRWKKWTVASLKNMARSLRQNDELKTPNTKVPVV